jgi:O-antigen ligase
MTDLFPGHGSYRDRLWLVAFGGVLLLPVMLIFHRGGSDVLVVLIGLLFMVESYLSRNWRWTEDRVVRVGLVAWAWMILMVSPFAYDPQQSFATALPWFRFIVFYAALRHWVLKREEPLMIVAMGLVWVLALVMADTLWQYVFHISLSGNPIDSSGRLTGPMDNVKVGLYMARLALPALVLTLFFFRDKPNWLISLALFWLVCIATVLLSGERTPFFSLMLGILTTIGILIVSEPKRRSYYILCLLLLTLCFQILFHTQPWLQLRAHALYGTLYDFKNSSYGQLFWLGYELGKEYWATGTGFKGFRELCTDYLAAGTLTHCNLHPHNPYIEWFAETGPAGLAIFVALVAAFLQQGIRAVRAGGGILAAGALGVCIMQFFPLMATQSFFSNWPAMVLWYSLAIAFSSLNLLQVNANRPV